MRLLETIRVEEIHLWWIPTRGFLVTYNMLAQHRLGRPGCWIIGRIRRIADA